MKNPSCRSTPAAFPSDAAKPAIDRLVNTQEYDESVLLVNDIRNAGDQLSGSHFQHWSLPASQISADFFCCAEHPKKGWFGLLADATGHGLPSAIFSVHTPLLFREAVNNGLFLPEIYERIHISLQRQGLTKYFVCGLLVRIHQRDIEIINAGMPDALLLASDGHVLDTFPSHYLPFGVASNGGMTEQHHRLARNEEAGLLLCSDGLLELGAPAGHAFGKQSVLDATAAGIEQVVDRLVERIALHGDVPHDDMSIVLIRAPIDTVAAAALPDDASPAQVAGIEAALRIVEYFPGGLVLTDADQHILYVNPAFSAITGYSPAEAIGQTPRLISSGRQTSCFYQQMWHALQQTGTWSGEIWNRRKDRSLYLEWADIHALKDNSGNVGHYIAAFTDITARRYREENLERHVLYDPLTGLAGKTLLADRGEQAMHRADRMERSVGILFIDFDRFNSINDSLGHDIGDQVLALAAKRFSAAVREDDTLARYGGDEFVCVLPDIVAREDAGIVAGKLLAALAGPIEVAGHQFKLSASIGISAYPSDSLLLDDLIVLASRAMQTAKQMGGNLFQFFCAETASSVEKQLELEARLHSGIDRGELELHYQPKVDLNSKRIIGAEALVRWRDPARGLVPPGEFIPLAEKSDLIAKIGSWVLTQACRDIARWDAVLPIEFHVAVNVSPLQLARSDLVAEVQAALANSGISPSRLQLEVTESLFIKDPESAAKTLNGILDLGVLLALDDFGTGYSNLGSLSHLPLDTFKLDQSFVRGIATDRNKQAIAKAVWFLADGMDKKVVAEGIESCKECVHLMAAGYRIGQGYKFGKPMAEENFLSHLANWHPEDYSCPKAFTTPSVGAAPPPSGQLR